MNALIEMGQADEAADLPLLITGLGLAEDSSMVAKFSGRAHMRGVQAALAAGQSIESRDPLTGCTPGMLAKAGRHREVRRYLASVGANVNACLSFQSIFSEALQERDFKRISYLITIGAPADTPGEKGMTALMLAAQAGNVEMMKWLVACGANFKARTYDEKGIFHCIVDRLDLATGLSVVLELIYLEMEVDTRYPYSGQTPLMVAASLGHAKAVRVLIDYGADLTAEAGNMRPVEWARRAEREEHRREVLQTFLAYACRLGFKLQALQQGILIRLQRLRQETPRQGASWLAY